MRSEGVLAMWPATYPAYPAAGENLKNSAKKLREMQVKIPTAGPGAAPVWVQIGPDGDWIPTEFSGSLPRLHQAHDML
jgi:hypothetical protein